MAFADGPGSMQRGSGFVWVVVETEVRSLKTGFVCRHFVVIAFEYGANRLDDLASCRGIWFEQPRDYLFHAEDITHTAYRRQS